MVWNDGDPLRFTVVDERGRHLASPLLSFGAGIRSYVWFALLKLDVGWRTDLRDICAAALAPEPGAGVLNAAGRPDRRGAPRRVSRARRAKCLWRRPPGVD